MTEGYHYTACGLDYVYLRNGFEVRETRHGKGVAIKDATGLHEAIGRAIVGGPAKLRGQEVRFLRSQLRLSQDGLARALRTRRASVARWEAQPDKAIPGTADAALRLFYALKADGHELASRLIGLLTELDEIQHGIEVIDHATFRDTEAGWQREAA